MIIIDMIRVPTRRWIIVLFFFFLLSSFRRRINEYTPSVVCFITN